MVPVQWTGVHPQYSIQPNVEYLNNNQLDYSSSLSQFSRDPSPELDFNEHRVTVTPLPMTMTHEHA